jgi:hypothetical protein
MNQRQFEAPARPMNCLEVRRLLLVEPESGNPDLLRHLQCCPQCVPEASQAWRFERALRTALGAEPSLHLEHRIALLDRLP